MTKQTVLQVFSSGMIGFGVHSADEIAIHISQNTQSKFFPLANAGPFVDNIEQEIAAEKYGLIPIYGRTLLFKDGAAPIVVMATNSEGRTWLYELPSVIESPKMFSFALRKKNVRGVGIFIPPSWIDSYPIESSTLKGTTLTRCMVDPRHATASLAALLSDWEVALTFPINQLSDDEKHGQSAAQSEMTSSILRRSIKHKSASTERALSQIVTDRFYDDDEFTSRFGDALSWFGDNIFDLDAFFEQCKFPSTKGLRDFHYRSSNEDGPAELRIIALEALERFLWKRQSSGTLKAESATYEARLKEELQYVEELKISTFFLRAVQIKKMAQDANPNTTMAFRGHSAGSLIAYLLNLSMVDPVENDIPAQLFFGLIDSDDPLMTELVFESGEVDHKNIDLAMSKAYKSRYVQFSYPTHISTRSALRSAAKFRTNREQNKHIYKVADSLPFTFSDELKSNLDKHLNSSQLGVELLADNNYAPYLAIARPLVGKIDAFHPNISYRAILPCSFAEFSPALDDLADKSPHILKEDSTGLPLMAISHQNRMLVSAFLTAVFRFRPHQAMQDTLSLTGRPALDFQNETYDDPEIFHSFHSGCPISLYHFQSEGMWSVTKDVKPKSLMEMANILSLYRPGPLDNGMMLDYTAAVTGKSDEFKNRFQASPAIHRILEPTFGVIIYQSQVFELLRDIAEYSEQEAIAYVRRKKDARQLELADFRNSGLSDTASRELIDEIERSSPVAFCKAHALYTAQIAYLCAWFRKRFPNEFLLPAINQLAKEDLPWGNGPMARVHMFKALIQMGVNIVGVNEESDLKSLLFELQNGALVPKGLLTPLSEPTLKKIEQRLTKKSRE